MPQEALHRIGLTRVNGEGRTPGEDLAAVEEPLQVRVNGKPFAVIMRTPGADASLVAGFLLSEGVICGRADLNGPVSVQRGPAHGEPHNVADALLRQGLVPRLEARRRVTMSSLAIDLARDSGITLLGFVRDHRANVYAHPERIA